jgi:hypothetical protein
MCGAETNIEYIGIWFEDLFEPPLAAPCFNGVSGPFEKIIDWLRSGLG